MTRIEPLISIVVTCYNHEQFIAECLQSIFHQTYRHIELLVLNDGSTDQSEQIILSHLEQSPFQRTEYHCHSNQGVVATRNIALTKIQGDYLIFVDSDDSLPMDYVEEVVKTARHHQADIVYTGMRRLGTEEVLLEADDFSLEQLYQGNFIHASSLIKTQSLVEVSYDMQLNRRKLEDYDFFMNLIIHHQYHPIPCRTTALNYRLLEESRSQHSNRAAYYEDYLFVIGKYKNDYNDYYQLALERHLAELARLGDIEASLATEQLTIEFEENGAFIPQEQLARPIRFQDSFTFLLPKTVTKIRIRPSNIPSFYRSLTLTNGAGTEILPATTTGIYQSGHYIFHSLYPYIDFSLKSLGAKELTLTYQRFNIKDITAPDYVAKLLSEELLTYNNVIRQQEAERQDSEARAQQWQEELLAKEAAYQTLQTQYHAVIGSRRWIIPTKIIDFFRRKK